MVDRSATRASRGGACPREGGCSRKTGHCSDRLLVVEGGMTGGRISCGDKVEHSLHSSTHAGSTMTTIQEILDSKHTDVWHVGPAATVREALEMMAARDVGAVPIVDGERLVGIFSERDCARKLVLANRSADDTLVAELMSSPVLYVLAQHTVAECMALMTLKRVRHLPVLEDGHLIGILAISDLVDHLISGQTEQIAQMATYITGIP